MQIQRYALGVNLRILLLHVTLCYMCQVILPVIRENQVQEETITKTLVCVLTLIYS